MDFSIDDSDDSALISMSIVQKRKATDNIHQKNSKQAKLNFAELSQRKTAKNDKLAEASIENPPNQDDDLLKTQEDKLLNSDQDSKWNESRSSYFDSNKKSTNRCPLCLKSFDSDSGYTVHMKQCAKKNNMTTQQLLKALDLQKKQMEERRALGLCSQIVPQSKKPVPKKNKKKENESQYDLALALALSKSLENKESKSTALGSEEVEGQTTLKDFGFKCPDKVTVQSKPKGKSIKKSILKERTNEERQRILTEKAAIVLLDEDQEEALGKRSGCRRFSFQNERVTKFQNKVSHLWNLSVNEEQRNWYVEELKHVMAVEEQKPQTVPKPNLPDNIQLEISKLKLPKDSIHQDWMKMINNDRFSDLMGVSRDNETFYLHSLILSVRCPGILEKDYKSVFRTFNLSSILIFLEYLYCGTLNGLIRSEKENLFNLAVNFNYEELINVLNCLEVNLSSEESSGGVIPSSLTPDPVEEERKMVEEEKEVEVVTIIGEDKDLFVEDMVDLTQSSHGSSTIDDEHGEKTFEDDTNLEKSYWSFLQHEKKREELEEMQKREEEKENSEMSIELEKIETSMKQQHEMMQQILNEFEEGEEKNFKNNLELEKIYQLQRRTSNDSATKGFDDDFVKAKDTVNVLSDSDTKTDEENAGKYVQGRESVEPDFEVPYFDPYENFNHFSDCRFSPVDLGNNLQSQSLITGDVSLESIKEDKNQNKSEEPKGDDRNHSKGPEYFSTPVTNRRASSRIKPSSKKSLNKSKKRKSTLAASSIVRKSLDLSLKARKGKSSSAKKKSLEKSSRKNLTEALTNSILNEFSKSPMFRCSTPVQKEKFVEVTPRTSRGIELVESVTPSPNYSNMGESLIKEHLSKYGLKKNLGKSKAKKILRHIYEELHPILNTETGKIVKMLPNQTPKGGKKAKSKATDRRKVGTTTKGRQPKKNSLNRKESGSAKNNANLNNISPSEKSDRMSDGNVDSLDGSTDYDSEGSEFEDLTEPLTQSVANSPVDLPSAFSEFLQMNPEFHRKILLYEPIWLEELQKKLKETFRKHFKLSDLMDFLDQKCITFRSAAQKRNNQKKNEKKKSSPRKKSSSS